MTEPVLDALVFRATPTAVCALPLAHVRETMRPLAFEVVAGVPEAVAGVGVVRGVPTPIVDVRTLLGAPRTKGERAARWIALAVGARSVMLAVDDVIGVRRLTLGGERPPLLAQAAKASAAAFSVLDRELVVVLEAARLLDEPAWKALAGALAGAKA